MPAARVDIAIFGGGIAGLWLLNRLQQLGLQVVLLESGQLGGGQSIASQGMIHGGIKYALGGSLTGASEAIAAMPERWRQCLAGRGEVDLRGAGVLAEHFHLWASGGLGSRVTTFLASRLTRGRVDTLARSDYPPPFDDPAFRGQVYRLVDLVLDIPDVTRRLAANCPGRILHVPANQLQMQLGRDGLESLSITTATGDALQLHARCYVFAAGAGNEALLAAAGASAPAMQRRPLHQVLVRHDYPHPLYAHCLGANPSPRLTISSHRGGDGRWVWYLGGDLATGGVDLSPAALIDHARAELAALLPWVDLGRSEWRTLAIDRAEPRQQGLGRPDQAFAAFASARNATLDNVIAAWPTKLTLAPDLSDRVCALLQRAGRLQPRPDAELRPLAALPGPGIASPCWYTLFD